MTIGTSFTIIQYSAVGFLFLLYIIQGIKVFCDDSKRSKKKKVRAESRAMSRAASRAASKAQYDNPSHSGEVDYYGQPIKKEENKSPQQSPTERKESEIDKLNRITYNNTKKNSMIGGSVAEFGKQRTISDSSIAPEEKE